MQAGSSGNPQAQVECREQRGLATVKAAAAYLGLSVAKLYEMMARGELPFVKFDKSRRIAWQALEELVQSHTISNAQ